MSQHRQNEKVDFLDSVFPLQGASHAEVANYEVDVPMRYAQCCATLADGRIARLKDSRQFMGWTGMNGSRCLLLSDGRRQIEIPAGSKPAADFKQVSAGHQFIARDGSLQFLQSEL